MFDHDTIRADELAEVCGGKKSSNEELTQALAQIKSSLDDLEQNKPDTLQQLLPVMVIAKARGLF